YLQDWLLLEADVDWRLDPVRGGASRVIADIGTHWIDLAEMTAGRKLEAVAAQVGHLHRRPTEDHAGMLLRLEGGIQGTFAVSQAAGGHRGDMELSLDGSAASATWRKERPDELWLGTRAEGLTRITREGDLVSPAARQLAALPAGPNESRRNLLAAAYAAIIGDDRPPAA
ncbi:MAG: Gfo/Idh/MocA family oxidoreductase, partial [Candidatus Limnocylindria bacterium]